MILLVLKKKEGINIFVKGYAQPLANISPL